VTVKAAFDSYIAALVARDRTVLEEILSEDFRFTNTNARFLSKSERIKSVLENPVFESLQYRNVEYRPFTDSALVFAEFQYISDGRHGTWLRQDSSHEDRLEPTMLFFGRSTFVFAKQAEQWRLVAQHNSHVQVDGG
jgi:Domain of unknown function (DUF4440)